ncbi:MAG: class I SAM-dependent methyltransferase [Opitutaceae bacterium]|nr:class I SAM-dependent methyltransferase [Opitutaceae bacterium]
MPRASRSRPAGEMRARDYITGEAFSLERAPEGWWVTTPAPDDGARYYGEVYYGQPGRRRFPALVESIQQQLYRRRARKVMDAVGRAGRVLDVGCGPGHLLACFAAAGWQAIGTEATHDAAAIPREKHGLNIKVGEVYEQGFNAGEFDAVVSWHSLEHMRAPGRVLDEVARVLRPGGVLLLSVPDFGSPEAQANPAAWFHLDVPRHLCHFPAVVLRAELERRGLRIEGESTCAPEYDSFSLVQTWQNRLGLPHNLFYLVLKGVDRGHASGRQRVAAVLLGAAMLPIAAVVTALRALRKTGAVIVFMARKIESGPKPAP